MDGDTRALHWGPSSEPCGTLGFAAGAASPPQLQGHPPWGPLAPHTPHLMRIPVGRASSSLAFLRFLSASSEDLGQSRVRGSRGHRRGPSAPAAAAMGAGYTVFPPSTHARKSFTSSTVMSPVVSSGFSMLLLGESMGPGEKAAGCSSGDPGEPRRWEGWGAAVTRGRPQSRAHGDVVHMAGTGRSLTVAVGGGALALGAARNMGAVRLRQLWHRRRAVAGRKRGEKLLPEPVPRGRCTGSLLQQSPHAPRGTSHLRQEVSWSRATSSRHSGSVTFLALSEKRSNSDGEIR